MAYKVECKTCKTPAQIPQRPGVKMDHYRCKCGGEFRRIGWQEMYRRREQSNARI